MRFSPVSAVPCSAPILFLRYHPLPVPAAAAPLIIIHTTTTTAAVRYSLRAKPYYFNDDERDIAEQALISIRSSQRRRMPRAEDEEPVRPPDKLRAFHLDRLESLTKTLL
jgi:hypothetical protein